MAYPKSIQRLVSVYSLLGVIVLSAIAGAVLFSPVEPRSIGSGTMSVGPNFYFVLSSGSANVSFAQTFLFTSGTWDASSVTFDGVRMAVQKTPLSAPNALVNISSWNPRTTSVGQAALRWNATSPSGSKLYVNLTGLPASETYIFYVDAVSQGNLQSDGFGSLSILWSTWSTHAFELNAVSSGGGSGGGLTCPPGTIASGGVCVPDVLRPVAMIPWLFLIIASIVFVAILVALVAPRERGRR